MSEYQYVAFRAIDRAVQKKDLEYMQRQSSRAEITPWSFDNEYHYGDFHGNALEMLRRGYDIHLHYANYGTRNLLIRLPHGFPDAKAAQPYLDDESLRFTKDKQGPGGTLSIEPFHESGELDELWDLDELIDRLVPLRAEILEGDLRPLYLANLAICLDGNHSEEETHEGPVPAGLGKLSDSQRALAELYGLDDAILAAAARGAPAVSAKDDPLPKQAAWLRTQTSAAKDAWLAKLMADPHSNVRTDILEEFRKSHTAPAWPTVRLNRTIAELSSSAVDVQRVQDRKAVDKAARDRAKRLARIATNPEQTLRNSEELVALHSAIAYTQVGQLLAELREALAGTDRAGLADEQAQKLKKENPTLHKLTGALRKHGFTPK